MKVSKFGGSSLASAEQIKKVCEIINSDEDRRIVVVSAPGKRYSEDVKVTDLLIKLADSVVSSRDYKKDLDDVIARFSNIVTGLSLGSEILDDIVSDLENRIEKYKGENSKFIDLIKSAGEDNTAKLVAAYLRKLGKIADYINPMDAGLFLSEEYGNARVLPESYENLKKNLNNAGIIVFPGFFGYSKKGEVVTFPRGGSDITGSILAAALDASLYENFTDVDCVFAANPNIVKNPKPISILTYREMRELAYAGFSVLHEETLEPVYKKKIPVNIKNTNNPEAPGTLIISEDKHQGNHSVVGIATEGGFSSIYLSKYLMNREIGFGRRLLSILERHCISYEHMPSGIDNISVLINSKYLEDGVEDLIINEIKRELDPDDISIVHNLALIMVVGEGMRHSIGVAARATNSFAKAGINIEMINQGSTEVSMMFAVREEDAEKAVISLYNEFFE